MNEFINNFILTFFNKKSVSKEVKLVLNIKSAKRDSVLYESALSSVIMHNCLNEEYHVVNTFNKCIQDIINNLEKYPIEQIIFSGWYYNNIENKCEKLIQKNGYPIYIEKINDPKYVNIMSVTNREDEPNKIIITINLYHLSNYNGHKAILAHEFRHILEMYIGKNKSFIGDDIDKMYDDPIKNKSHYFDLVCDIINLFSLSEERARIDGTIHYLKDENIDNILDGKNNYEKIAKLIDYSKDYNLLYKMQIYLNELTLRNEAGLYDIILLFVSVWNKYENKKINIKSFDDNEILANKILEFLNNNYNQYYKRLIDTIATHILTK